MPSIFKISMVNGKQQQIKSTWNRHLHAFDKKCCYSPRPIRYIYNHDDSWQDGSLGKRQLPQVPGNLSLIPRSCGKGGRSRELTLQSCPHTSSQIPAQKHPDPIHAWRHAHKKKTLKPGWKPDFGHHFVVSFTWKKARDKYLGKHTATPQSSEPNESTLEQEQTEPLNGDRGRDCSRPPCSSQPRQSSTRPHPNQVILAPYPNTSSI